MFLLSLYGNHKLYSTKQLAEQNASNWLHLFVIDNHWLWGEDNLTGRYRKQFEISFYREDYASCVDIWNKYALDKHDSNCPTYSGSLLATIKKIKMDEAFK